jgi:hypothetical protein
MCGNQPAAKASPMLLLGVPEVAVRIATAINNRLCKNGTIVSATRAWRNVAGGVALSEGCSPAERDNQGSSLGQTCLVEFYTRIVVQPVPGGGSGAVLRSHEYICESCPDLCPFVGELVSDGVEHGFALPFLTLPVSDLATTHHGHFILPMPPVSAEGRIQDCVRAALECITDPFCRFQPCEEFKLHGQGNPLTQCVRLETEVTRWAESLALRPPTPGEFVKIHGRNLTQVRGADGAAKAHIGGNLILQIKNWWPGMLPTIPKKSRERSLLRRGGQCFPSSQEMVPLVPLVVAHG